MSQFITKINDKMRGLTLAVLRFPLTVLFLFASSILMIYITGNYSSQSDHLEQMMLALVFGAVLGVVVQFTIERFATLAKRRFLLYLITAVVTIAYFLLLSLGEQVDGKVVLRTYLLILALLSLMLWIPSYQLGVDFNTVALIHVKAFFTSFLYSLVLSVGIAAIIGSIDLLLFSLSYRSYTYMLIIVWMVFATIYYLSLLPRFHSMQEEDQRKREAISVYPKFLSILVSNIAIPLLSAYTLVLLAYFLKIVVTRTWPSGRVSVLVLIYTIAGLILYILASSLEDKFSKVFRKLFPKLLIPIVIMQLIAIGIRIKSYGITESRYYIVLFGIASLIAGILLFTNNSRRNGGIALLVAMFSIFSILPPVDAFTISKNSQIKRLEALLEEEGILSNDKITPKENVSQDTRVEVTSILYYLEWNHSFEDLEWLPKDFSTYQDMKTVLGFGQDSNLGFNGQQYITIFLDTTQPLPIQGYDILIDTSTNSQQVKEGNSFELDGKQYDLSLQEDTLSVLDQNQVKLIGMNLRELAQKYQGLYESKIAYGPEELTYEVSQDEYDMKVIFKNIHITTENQNIVDFYYEMYVLFSE